MIRRTPTGPARILRHGRDWTAVDRYGVILERHSDPHRLAIRIAAVHRLDVTQEPKLTFSRSRA